jgi:protease I
MSEKLHGIRIAILATDGFEQAELTSPLQALRDAGAEVDVISPKAGEIQGMQHDKKGDMTKVDIVLKNASAERYDALVLPGGVANPDTLRIDRHAVDFVGHFVASGKPIGAICHGPWTLLEIPDAVDGKTMTSWPSLQTDLKNGGANWVDREVVVDGKLVTSRKPDDLPAFNAKLIELIGQLAHA